MERSRNGTLMSLNSQDFENLESVEKLYFGERETEDNQEPENFFLEESSSESENENDEANSCIKIREAELSQKEKIEKFIADTCKGKLAEQGAACSTILSREDFYDSWNNCQELSSAELDLVILGVIQSSLNCRDVNLSGRTEKQRKRTRMVFFYHGRRICKEIVFIF